MPGAASRLPELFVNLGPLLQFVDTGGQFMSCVLPCVIRSITLMKLDFALPPSSTARSEKGVIA